MLSLEFSMNLMMLLVVVAVSGFAGFMLRSRQLAKSRMKLIKVESEMISSHAEILELQKEYMELELKLRGVKDNVVPMPANISTEAGEKLPNVSIRKKMLGAEPNKAESENLLNKETRAAK